MAKLAKISKMSSKMAKYGSGSGTFTNLITIAMYVAAIYILYRVVMYFLNMRSSAMPDVSESSSSKTGGAKGDKKPGCSTGTCGGS